MRKLSYNAVCAIVVSCMVASYVASFFFVRRLRPREFKREFSAINSLYEKGDYRRAIAAYQNLAARYDIECMTLYYNLANAYYRSGDLGRAILYYTKAQRLAPRDHDVGTNLRIARTKAGITIRQKQRPSPQSVGRKVLKLFSLFEGVAASLTLRWLLIVCVILTEFFGRRRRYFLRVAIVLAVLFYASLGVTTYKAYVQNSVREAVVLDRDSPVRKEPVGHLPPATVLKQGTTLRVKGSHKGWCKIASDDGTVGWMRQASLGEI